MLNMFGQNAFARKRKAKVMRVDSGSSHIETLESRIVPASLISTSFSNGTLFITGSGDADTVTINMASAGGVNTATLVTANLSPGSSLGPHVITNGIVVDMGNGNDTVNVANAAAATVDGTFSFDLGSGDDALNINTAAAAAMTFTGDVISIGGTENDVITIGGAGAITTIANLSVDNGVGAGAQTIALTAVNVNGNASLINSGEGLQTVTLAPGAADSIITGNLAISQAHQAASASNYVATITDYNVSGTVTVRNGNSTGSATTTIQSTSAAVNTIGGTVSVINGNNNANAINLTAVAAGQLVLAGNVGATNGTGTATNAITLTGTTTGTNAVNNRTRADFTNGSGAANTITLGTAALANTVNSLVTASNQSNAAGANLINVDNNTFNRNVTLANGLFANNPAVLATANTVNVATTANVSVVGNLIINNANTGAANNAVNIGTGAFGLTTTTTAVGAGSSGAGDVIITNGISANGVAGANSVTITGDAIGRNTLAGNLWVRNNSTTSAAAATTRAISIDGLTTNTTTGLINGRTGVTLNNFGIGNSTTSIGTAIGIAINGVGGLFVQDGSGTANLSVQNATIGTLANVGASLGFRYQDLGGGTDTINIGTVAAPVPTVIVNGVTRFETGSGNDAVTIGTVTGPAAAPNFGSSVVFNDSVFIDLGNGTDTLLIGAFAASPGLSSAAKFRFNGGNGLDRIQASPLSVANYVVGTTIPLKLRSKIAGFEVVAPSTNLLN